MRVLALLFLGVALAPLSRAGTVTVHFTGLVTEIEQGDFNALPPVSLGDSFAGK
jgi:hypothetical protein